jgi:hypothetical protein
VIVKRHYWKVKHSCRGEFIKLIKAAMDEAGIPNRVYSYIYGPYDTVVVDAEYETEEDAVRHRYDWSLPKISEWAQKRHDLLEGGLVNELLRVH